MNWIIVHSFFNACVYISFHAFNNHVPIYIHATLFIIIKAVCLRFLRRINTTTTTTLKKLFWILFILVFRLLQDVLHHFSYCRNENNWIQAGPIFVPPPLHFSSLETARKHPVSNHLPHTFFHFFIIIFPRVIYCSPHNHHYRLSLVHHLERK